MWTMAGPQSVAVGALLPPQMATSFRGTKGPLLWALVRVLEIARHQHENEGEKESVMQPLYSPDLHLDHEMLKN